MNGKKDGTNIPSNDEFDIKKLQESVTEKGVKKKDYYEAMPVKKGAKFGDSISDYQEYEYMPQKNNASGIEKKYSKPVQYNLELTDILNDPDDEPIEDLFEFNDERDEVEDIGQDIEDDLSQTIELIK